MPVEVETKLRVTDPVALRVRLAAAGVRLAAPAHQEDTFFTHLQRDLVRADEALRLRLCDGHYELTFKGPRQPGTAKTRVEETVGCTSDPTALLGHLGFQPAARVAKRREQGMLEGVAIALDEVSGLGWFIELELVVAQHETRGAQETIRAVSGRLGLAAETPIRESYVEMLTRGQT